MPSKTRIFVHDFLVQPFRLQLTRLAAQRINLINTSHESAEYKAKALRPGVNRPLLIAVQILCAKFRVNAIGTDLAVAFYRTANFTMLAAIVGRGKEDVTERLPIIRLSFNACGNAKFMSKRRLASQHFRHQNCSNLVLERKA